jgi:outer membrane protein OmpA-like peptidoglycan-associated protein
MKNKRIVRALTVMVALLTIQGSWAQQTVQRELVSEPIDFFVPHWYVGGQIGAAADVGETTLGNLVSPAIQLTGGYRWSEILGVRATLSGLWAKNRYAYPKATYKWNFIQPSVDLEADVTNLIGGWDGNRPFAVRAFAGLGLAYSFGNGDAEKADERFNEYYQKLNNGEWNYVIVGTEFQKLWTGGRWNPVVRAGVSGEYKLTEDLALTLEVNGNMLPDHFNSKRGKNDNRDWHFNALVGVRLNLGPSRGRTEAVYREIPVVVPEEKPKKDPRFQDDDAIAMTENVQFELNKSIIRESEHEKIIRVARYLINHPQSHVELTGFADKLTGNATINQRLSVERAQAVAQFLVNRGISRDRISKYAKGDRVQPFSVNEDNRVTICIVIEEGLKKQVDL